MNFLVPLIPTLPGNDARDQVSSSSKWMSPAAREVPGKTVCASVPP